VGVAEQVAHVEVVEVDAGNFPSALFHGVVAGMLPGTRGFAK
jgi:hypothetical protein